MLFNTGVTSTENAMTHLSLAALFDFSISGSA
jgi:hypothetical protein